MEQSMPQTFSFETAATRVLGALPPRTGAALERVLETPDDGADLHGPVDAHLQRLQETATSRKSLDLPLARRLAGHCHGLLDSLASESTPDARARLARAAVRYFILEEDAESDAASILGLDDDAQVIRAVARELGCGDILRDME